MNKTAITAADRYCKTRKISYYSNRILESEVFTKKLFVNFRISGAGPCMCKAN